MLTSKDIDAALDLANDVLHLGSDPDFAEDLLKPIGSLIGADMAAFREIDLSDGAPRIGRHAPCGVPDRLHNQYLNDFYKLDPAILRVSRGATRSGLANVMEVGLYGMDSYSTSQWASETGQRYLRGFLTPNRLLNNICMHVLLGDKRRLFLLDFHRPSSSTPFSEQELALAQMICPAVQLLCAEFLAPARPPVMRRGSQGAKTCLFEFGALDIAARAAPSVASAASNLTDRERDVILAVMKGLSNKEIARHLGVSVRTAENHLRAIYKKCDVHTRAQLTASLIALVN